MGMQSIDIPTLLTVELGPPLPGVSRNLITESTGKKTTGQHHILDRLSYENLENQKMLAPKAAAAAMRVTATSHGVRQSATGSMVRVMPNRTRTFSTAMQAQPTAVASKLARPALQAYPATLCQSRYRAADSNSIMTRVRSNPTVSQSWQQQRCRFSSTTTASPSTSASNSAVSSGTDKPLDWNTFFKLRKTRRYFQLMFSAAGFVAFGVVAVEALNTGLAAPIVGQIPLDPMLTMGGLTMACAILGWLVGPGLGAQIFRLFYLRTRQSRSQMMAKENDFFARVKKHRVDPSTSSVGNPLPDFYGEKISSVSGYRQWLKDQRAFNKKRAGFS